MKNNILSGGVEFRNSSSFFKILILFSWSCGTPFGPIIITKKEIKKQNFVGFNIDIYNKFKQLDLCLNSLSEISLKSSFYRNLTKFNFAGTGTCDYTEKEKFNSFYDFMEKRLQNPLGSFYRRP